MVNNMWAVQIVNEKKWCLTNFSYISTFLIEYNQTQILFDMLYMNLKLMAIVIFVFLVISNFLHVECLSFQK